MSKLKFITMLACVSLTCDPSSVSADHHEQHHEEISPAQMLAEFESEAERRRGEEGDHFDEGAYKFERSMMERRMALEERRIALDKDFRALDEEGQEYWSNRQREDKDRQRAEIDNRRADFEAEADRRRGEEGEDFDEEAYIRNNHCGKRLRNRRWACYDPPRLQHENKNAHSGATCPLKSQQKRRFTAG